MLLVGFYGDVNQLIIHPCKTAGHYLRGSFFVDLLLCFPWELIINFLIPEHNEGHSGFGHKMSPHWMHCSVRIIKILQAYRLPSVFNYLEMNIRTKVNFCNLRGTFGIDTSNLGFIRIKMVIKNHY